MGLFSKRQKQPKWATVLGSMDRYELFRSKLLAASGDRIDVAKTDRNGMLVYGGITIAIVNLAAMCNELEEDKWDAEIERWVSAFSDGADRPVPQYPRDIHMLRLQLYPVGYFDAFDENEVVCREDIPGVLTSVVIDWPDSYASLSGDDIAEWKANQDKVIDTLQKQLAKAEPYDGGYVAPDGNHDDVINYILDDDLLTSTHALALDKIYPQLVGTDGALVGIPYRHMIIVKPLNAEPVAETVAKVRDMVQHMYEQNKNNYVVSDKLYRYRDGKFVVMEK